MKENFFQDLKETAVSIVRRLVVFNLVVGVWFWCSTVGAFLVHGVVPTVLLVILALAAFITFVIGNVSIVFGEKQRRKKLKQQSQEKLQKIKIDGVKTLGDCENALANITHLQTFSSYIRGLRMQINNFWDRQTSVRNVLSQRFSPTEMTYLRFDEVVTGVENVMCNNIKKVLVRFSVFDENGYQAALREKESGNVTPSTQASIGLYEEHIDFIGKVVDGNNEMLFKLQELLSEIAKITKTEEDSRQETIVVDELNNLISNTYLYK